VTRPTSINSNLNHADELTSPKRKKRYVWVRPEIREIDFKATANGGGGGVDAQAVS